MRLSLVFLVLSVGASGALAGQKIPLSAAIAQCQDRSTRYAQTLADADANTPSAQKIDDRFRSCVFAKSGKYPPRKPVKKGLSLSGSAAIGIVVRD